MAGRRSVTQATDPRERVRACAGRADGKFHGMRDFPQVPARASRSGESVAGIAPKPCRGAQLGRLPPRKPMKALDVLHSGR